MSRELGDDLNLANYLADEADGICRRWFGGVVEQSSKGDGSPVTAADLEVEKRIREILRARRANDQCLGEEISNENVVGLETPTWLIDPIDHTRHFARGDPNYGSLITLMIGGIAQVATISAPSLGLRWTAARGCGAFRNGVRIQVSETARLEFSHFALAGHREWVYRYEWRRISQLMDRCSYVCGTEGGFLPAMKVASSQLDAFAEPWGEIWDHAAQALIVEEAGGRATTLIGSKVRGGSLLVSNGRIHDQLLDYFK